MDESQGSSGHGDVKHTAPPRTIHRHSTPLTQEPYPVVEINRPLRDPRKGYGPRNEPALNNAIPRTVEMQPHVRQPQTVLRQQYSSSIDNFVRRDNNDTRQWDVTGVQDNAMAVPPKVAHHGGLAEQRRDRSPPAVGLNTGPTPPRVWEFVIEGNSDSAQPSKPVRTDDERRKVQLLRRQLKEKGEACLRCYKEQKACDREDTCWKCRLRQPGTNDKGEATVCFRGFEKLWLWREVEQRSLNPGSRNAALHCARNTTFTDSSQRLREVLRLSSTLPREDGSIVVSLTSRLGHSPAPSPIEISPGSLAERLQSMPETLTNQIRKALTAHIPDLILPSLQSTLTGEEKSLVALAQSAFRFYNFISNATHVEYHASARLRGSAREVSCFLIEYCVRLLAAEVEKVLTKLRPMIRQRNPSGVLKHVFGLYYGILLGLQQLDTQTALDVILHPLKYRASVVIRDLGLLYREIYGSEETLQEFVDMAMPAMSETHHLHLSPDLSATNNRIMSWNFAWDPFHKDFSVHLRDLLVSGGQVAWTHKSNPVQQSVPSPGGVDVADDSPLPRGRHEASELRSSQPSHKSPDETLRDSWDDGSTYIQSPTEVEHGAELRRVNQVRVGDVKTPQDLRCITGGSTGTDLKRDRSAESRQCTSPSPPPKRSELDAGQACLGHPEHQFDDAAFMLDFSEASQPSSWDPLLEAFFD